MDTLVIQESFLSGRLLALVLAMLAGFLFITGIVGIRIRRRAEAELWRDEVPPVIQLLYPLIHYLQTKIRLRQEKLDQIKAKINMAGLDYAVLPAEVVALRVIGGVIGGMVFALIYFKISDWSMMWITMAFGIMPLGYAYPDIWLNDVIKRRQHLYAKQFPFLLDLLTLSMRAGLTFPSALSQAIEKLPEGPVKNDFERLNRDTRTGVARRDALVALAQRNQLLAVTNFVASVNQAEESGAVLGDVLTSQAKQRRTERFLKAEKLAGEAPVKMLLPLMALLFPITFIIIGFPIVMKFMNSPASRFFQ